MGDRMSSVKPRPNFRIIEKDEFPWDEFREDFKNMNYSKDDLIEKYNLTSGSYYNKQKQLRNEGITRPRWYGKPSPNKYLKKIGRGKCVIHKYFGKKCVYFGTYPNIEIARYVRDKLVEEGWTEEAYYKYAKLYSTTHNGNRGYSRPAYMKEEAISKYEEFKKLFFSKQYKRTELFEILGITRYQYEILRKMVGDELKQGVCE